MTTLDVPFTCCTDFPVTLFHQHWCSTADTALRLYSSPPVRVGQLLPVVPKIAARAGYQHTPVPVMRRHTVDAQIGRPLVAPCSETRENPCTHGGPVRGPEFTLYPRAPGTGWLVRPLASALTVRRWPGHCVGPSGRGGQRVRLWWFAVVVL